MREEETKARTQKYGFLQDFEVKMPNFLKNLLKTNINIKGKVCNILLKIVEFSFYGCGNEIVANFLPRSFFTFLSPLLA